MALPRLIPFWSPFGMRLRPAGHKSHHPTTFFGTGNLCRQRKVQIICTNTCKILPVTEFFHFLPELTGTGRYWKRCWNYSCPNLFRFRLSLCQWGLQSQMSCSNSVEARRQTAFMINRSHLCQRPVSQEATSQRPSAAEHACAFPGHPPSLAQAENHGPSHF